MNKKHIFKLLRFCGYGDYPNIQVLYIGNEEGLGGAENAQVINARINKYYNKGIQLVEGNRNEGYYWNPPKAGPAPNVPILNFMARQMLRFNEGNGINWFQTFQENPQAKDQIIQYLGNELFREGNDRSFRSGLFDLRPLPRLNERQRPGLYGNDFKWGVYLRAFRYSLRFNQGLQPYSQWRIIRAEIFVNLLQTAENLRVIIVPGDRHGKKRFFEFINLLEGVELLHNFEERNLPCGQPYYYNEISINNRAQIPIYIPNFFQSGRGIGLNGLEELTEVIRPIIQPN